MFHILFNWIEKIESICNVKNCRCFFVLEICRTSIKVLGLAIMDNERKNIVETDMQAKDKVERIMKNSDPLYWVGMMNNFKNQAEEIVGKELIYV